MNAKQSTPESLPCPACRQVTHLPADVARTLAVGHRRLRCPHCQQRFELQQLLEQPGLCWEVVDDLPIDASAGAHATVAADDESSPVSPGALTVDMPGHQTLVDDEWTYGLDQEDADIRQPDYHADEVSEYSEELIAPTVGSLPVDAAHELAMRDVSLDDARLDPPVREELPYPTGDLEEDESEPVRASGSKKPDWSNFQAKPRKRGRGQRGSSLWLVLQAALGGLAAIPISLLLMWHLLGTDIAGAAPWVAQYVPWIVPAKFHASSVGASTSPAISTSATQQPTALGGITRLPTVELPAEIATDDASQAPGPQPEPNALATDEESYGLSNTADVERLLDNSANALQDQAGDNLIVGEDRARSLDTDADADASLDEELELPLDAPPELDATAVENSFARIRQADASLEEWSQAFQAKRTDLKSLALSTYEELADLAKALDQLPPRNAVLRTVRGQIRPISRQVQSKAEVQSLIEQGALHWLRSRLSESTASVPSPFPAATDGESSRDSAAVGLAIIIDVDHVESVNRQGESWTQLMVRTDSPTAGVQLEIRIPPDVAVSLAEDQLQPGERLFLLGTVMPERAASSEQKTGEPKADFAPSKKVFVANYLYPLLPK